VEQRCLFTPAGFLATIFRSLIGSALAARGEARNDILVVGKTLSMKSQESASSVVLYKMPAPASYPDMRR
jgi:hypothetical protein